MPIDGIMLSAVKHELKNKIIGAKVEKVVQPERDEIILYLHTPQLTEERNPKLILCANPSYPKLHLSNTTKENPKVPPNFCMLLRKHLMSSRITDIEQPSLERVLIISLEARTEMFEMVKRKLIVEIMGRYSNIIFTDENNIIYDALRPVDFTVSTKRQLLPGMVYELPPAQDKKIINENISFDDFDFTSGQRLDKELLSRYIGFSSLICREIAFLSCGRTDVVLNELSDSEKEKLIFQLKKFCKKIKEGEFKSQILWKEEPFDFYCFEIFQYGMSVKNVDYSSPSKAIDEFFAEKVKSEHIKRNSADILKVLTNTASRINRKIEAQTQDLVDCDKAQKYKDYGDLILGNLHLIKSGAKSAFVKNYYSENDENVEIPLNPSLNPSQNAQKYYKIYKKAQTARSILQRELPLAKKELEYIESIFDSLVFAENLSDLAQIRRELTDSGYIKNNQKINPKQKKASGPKLLEFTSSEGVKILVGKNNYQNDYLTLKVANKLDIWFHTKAYPGCHTVLFASEKETTDISLNEAAIIAATYSKAGQGQKVAVDYTQIKNVKKPNGSKAGMVTYDNYKTAYVVPSQELADNLSKK